MESFRVESKTGAKLGPSFPPGGKRDSHFGPLDAVMDDFDFRGVGRIVREEVGADHMRVHEDFFEAGMRKGRFFQFEDFPVERVEEARSVFEPAFRSDAAFEKRGMDAVAQPEVGLDPVAIHPENEIGRVFFKPSPNAPVVLFKP